MFDRLRQLVRPQPAQPSSAIPAGERVYAVGDIHGRADLFSSLLAAIEADDAGRPAATTTIVLLGDLIDRGPDSAGVLAKARETMGRRPVRIIAGNHEEVFLRCFGNTDILRSFLRYGGRETILSWPLDVAAWNAASLEEAQAMLPGIVPAEDLAFIRSFEDHIVIGDYCFVHAGIYPGVALEEQSLLDLRWIREPFLSDRSDHGFVVVHGHTITGEPEIRGNRIGIDTGAYMTGKLTALGLEGTERWLIATEDQEGTIGCKVQSL